MIFFLQGTHLARVAFLALAASFRFFRACHRLLFTGCVFSRACRSLRIFPRFLLVTCCFSEFRLAHYTFARVIGSVFAFQSFRFLAVTESWRRLPIGSVGQQMSYFPVLFLAGSFVLTRVRVQLSYLLVINFSADCLLWSLLLRCWLVVWMFSPAGSSFDMVDSAWETIRDGRHGRGQGRRDRDARSSSW